MHTNRQALVRTMFCTLAVCAALIVGAALSHAGEPWPCFRGPQQNNHSDARTPIKWSETENVLWKTAIHGRGWSSPVTWGEQIWLSTATEDGRKMSVLCLDAKSGKVIHDKVLFENEEPRFCHAMNSYASPTPVIQEGRVFVHFGSYGTACLDSENCKVLWQRRDLPCDHFRGPGSSPVSYNDWLIIHYDGADVQYVVALDKETGKTIWKQDRDIDYGTDNGDIFKAYSTPLIVTIDGQDQLISPASKATIAYNPKDGSELWRVRYDGFSATAQPLFDGRHFYVNSGFSKAELFAVQANAKGDVTDSHVQWNVKKTIGSKPSQLLVDGLIYNVHDKGVASCLDAQTGEELWAKRLKGQFSASPLYAGGNIYLFNHEGQAWVLAPGRTYKELAANQLDDGGLSSPAVYEESLIVRTSTHLYRLGRK